MQKVKLSLSVFAKLYALFFLAVLIFRFHILKPISGQVRFQAIPSTISSVPLWYSFLFPMVLLVLLLLILVIWSISWKTKDHDFWKESLYPGVALLLTIFAII